jgi:hypothetical protein
MYGNLNFGDKSSLQCGIVLFTATSQALFELSCFQAYDNVGGWKYKEARGCYFTNLHTELHN